MAIRKEKWDALEKELLEWEIRDEDLVEKFIKGSGAGGQKVNKTSSCVYLKHLPTGIEIKCQQDRSQELNRYYARQELIEKIKEKVFKVASEKKKEASKIRAQKKRRSRRQKEKMVEEKRDRGEVKERRRKPKED